MKVPFYTSWNSLRQQYKLYWLLLLTFLPGVGFIGILLNTLLHSDNAIIVPFLCWGIPFGIVNSRIQRFLCPRCGKGFYKPNAYTVSFYTQKCVHCGLPKWSGEDDTDTDKGAP